MNRFNWMKCIGWVIVLGWIVAGYALAADDTAPTTTVRLVFIHHSTGGNWLADANEDGPYGGLGLALMNNNYAVSATNYGSGYNGIGDRTDIPNWPEWFTGADHDTIMQAVYAESEQNVDGFGEWSRIDPGNDGENTIVMFKSCFPNSDLFGSPTDAPLDTPNKQYTVANAKAVYNDILNYFQTRQDKLFIVISAPPQLESDYGDDYQTPAQRAANARALNNWLVNDWLADYPYANVAVFDYFNVLTSPDNHHRYIDGAVEHTTAVDNNFAIYTADPWDSHPSTTGHQKATQEFVPLLNYYHNRWQEAQNVPLAPEFDYSISGVDVTAYWSSVSGATGYTLYFAPSPFTGPESIQHVDMGGNTSISVNLWPGASYFVAVTAYNDAGESGYSNIELFTIPVE